MLFTPPGKAYDVLRRRNAREAWPYYRPPAFAMV
ncbi:hypothetical protein RKD54_004571 [Pseudarthrobacter sp. SLBN-100]